VLTIPFVDDPTNDDAAYDRVRMRRLLDGLEAEGLGRGVLAATATRMQRAAVALERRAAAVAASLARVDGAGDVILDRDALAGVEADTRMRLLAGAIRFVAGGDYRPRSAALEGALDRVMAGGATTLSGCRIEAEGAGLRVFRELAGVTGAVPATSDAVWDGRWRLTGQAETGPAETGPA
jgi:tRNA(Ile)-lysidine synthase